MRFAELLDAVDKLPPEDQAELVEIVRRRLVERGREELAKEIQQFHAGRCAPRTSEETLRDILS